MAINEPFEGLTKPKHVRSFNTIFGQHTSILRHIISSLLLTHPTSLVQLAPVRNLTSNIRKDVRSKIIYVGSRFFDAGTSLHFVLPIVSTFDQSLRPQSTRPETQRRVPRLSEGHLLCTDHDDDNESTSLKLPERTSYFLCLNI